MFDPLLQKNLGWCALQRQRRLVWKRELDENYTHLPDLASAQRH
jgi:hypothetical protein